MFSLPYRQRLNSVFVQHISHINQPSFIILSSFQFQMTGNSRSIEFISLEQNTDRVSQDGVNPEETRHPFSARGVYPRQTLLHVGNLKRTTSAVAVGRLFEQVGPVFAFFSDWSS